MEFKTYEIPGGIQNAIYFLINNDEVIYVGQTKNGLKRILQHGDKFFNKYSFIEKPIEALDYWEDYYIMKYQPKYNNSYNHNRLSLNSAYNQLKYYVKSYINMFEFPEYIEKKGIEIKMFKNVPTITKEDFKYIIEQSEKEYGVSQ